MTTADGEPCGIFAAILAYAILGTMAVAVAACGVAALGGFIVAAKWLDACVGG